ncbi:MAG: hypothetical protein IKD40_01365 [Bacteroidaceae bacterium]|nr:hypothetical protein [Bacteroidaceae bacterium]
MRKIIPFKGVVYNCDNLYAQDGDCLDLLNVRVKNGSLQPLPVPDKVASFPYRYKQVYWHSMASRYLCITENGGHIHIYNEKFESADADSLHMLQNCVGVERMEIIGNIVSLFTDTAILYAIFDTDHYKWLGERPQMPDITINTTSQVVKVKTEDCYFFGNPPDESSASSYWSRASIGYYDECISKLNGMGCYIDRALFRLAYKLYDGSYISFSPIFYVEDRNSVEEMSKDSGNFYSAPNNPSDGYSTYTVKVQGFKPSFVFEGLDLGNWENIIVSLDIFTSGSIPGHKVVEKGNIASVHQNEVYTVLSADYERYEIKPDGEIYSEVLKHSLFYKVMEYDIYGNRLNVCEDVSPTSLALCATMGDESISPSTITASCSYVFNGRLHLGNLRETYFKGYSDNCYYPQGMETKEIDAVIFTELNTKNGLAQIKKDFEGRLKVGYNNGRYYLSPYIMYPDVRATRTFFIVTIDGVRYKKDFKLTAHAMLNLACYLNDYSGGMYVSISAVFAVSNTKLAKYYKDNILKLFGQSVGEYTLVYSNTGYWSYKDANLDISLKGTEPEFLSLFYIRGVATAGDTITVKIAVSNINSMARKIADVEICNGWDIVEDSYAPEERNLYEIRENVMRVSGVDNPFFFPAKQTYTPSDNKILAMCSNTVTLSQGEFGQHPLYVFCSNGIWVMAIDDTGASAYTTCYPLSREVCNNVSSVIGIDSGVLFSTSKGLLLIMGGNVTNLSTAIDTANSDCEVLLQNNLLNKIATVVSLQECYRRIISFVDYLKNAVVGFLYSEQELIVSNHNHSYSYIYSLSDGAWSRCDRVFKGFVNTYPHLMAIEESDGNKTLLSLFSTGKEKSNSFAILTRPMLWGTKIHKRIMHMMLHAMVMIDGNSDTLFKGIACYLLCSNDGRNYKIISGSERRGSFNDLSFPYVPTQSYRYYMIAVVGNVLSDSRITAMEIDVDTSWNNRIN